MINKNEVRKILLRMIGSNLPVPAVLVSCCFIDFLAKQKYYQTRNNYERFIKYIENEMSETFKELSKNDIDRKEQIDQLNCAGFKLEKHPKRNCGSSVELLYRHIRCGLVHNYSERLGTFITNKPKKDFVVDPCMKYKGINLESDALVINGPVFVRKFISSLWQSI